MCITAQCPDPTQVGIWWRDDAAWRLYSKPTIKDILQALLNGSSSLDLHLASPAHPRGTSYHIDFLKLEQTNRSSGHKRPIKLILPSSFQNPNSNFFNKVENSIEVDCPAPIARFRLHKSCLLVIRKGDIVNWAVDGKMDAVVCPRRKWRFQAGPKDINGSLLSASTMQTLMTDMCFYRDEAESRHGSDGNIASGLHDEQAKRSVAASLQCAAGPELQESLHKSARFATLGRCGDAVITSGYKLPASHIIHVIVPKYQNTENAVVDGSVLLERTYKAALALATANGMRYVAFPAMACGGGGFPVGVAVKVAMQVVGGSSNNEGVKEIHFVLMGEERTYKEWVMQASKLFSASE